jgi:hypothetical protein
VVARGEPRRLKCVLSIESQAADATGIRALEASLEGVKVEGIKVFSASVRDPSRLRLSLRTPSTTPPGRYPGSVRIGERTIAIDAEIAPHLQVRADPARLVVVATPRSTRTAELTLLNTGNVPCEVPMSSTFCLFDGHGVDHAFLVALTTDPPPEKQRIDLLLDDLAESHGGLVRARATQGQGPIPPGEAREIRLRLRFSGRLRPGRQYAGAWDLPGLRVPVRVTAIEPAPKAEPQEGR